MAQLIIQKILSQQALIQRKNPIFFKDHLVIKSKLFRFI